MRKWETQAVNRRRSWHQQRQSIFRKRSHDTVYAKNFNLWQMFPKKLQHTQKKINRMRFYLFVSVNNLFEHREYLNRPYLKRFILHQLNYVQSVSSEIQETFCWSG